MLHLNHAEGLVTRRFFKQYLAQQGLTSKSDLIELRDNVQITRDVYLAELSKKVNLQKGKDLLTIIIDN